MTTSPKFTNFEYRSIEEINDMPLIHINIGTHPETGRPLVAKGIVAIGNIAFGVISIGVAAFGVVTIAALGMGVVSLASFAIGVIAIGAAALGYEYALGVVVQSAKAAYGLNNLESKTLGWSLAIVASIALAIWGLRKIKAELL
ncbi:MAG: hypothetical protein N2D54_09760 [Chloroflexota bacterium]